MVAEWAAPGSNLQNGWDLTRLPFFAFSLLSGFNLQKFWTDDIDGGERMDEKKNRERGREGKKGSLSRLSFISASHGFSFSIRFFYSALLSCCCCCCLWSTSPVNLLVVSIISNPHLGRSDCWVNFQYWVWWERLLIFSHGHRLFHGKPPRGNPFFVLGRIDFVFLIWECFGLNLNRIWCMFTKDEYLVIYFFVSIFTFVFEEFVFRLLAKSSI